MVPTMGARGKPLRSITGVLYPTRFASPQGSLIPLNPQEFLVLYRPPAPRRPARSRGSTPQLLLFELVPQA